MTEIARTSMIHIAGSCLSLWAIPVAVACGVWTDTMTYLLALVVGGAITVAWNGLGAWRGFGATPAERWARIGAGTFGLAVAVAAWIVQQPQPWLGMPPLRAGQCVALALLATPIAVYLVREWRSRSRGAALALVGLGALGTLLLATACAGWDLRFAHCEAATSGALVGVTATLLACRGFLGQAGTRVTWPTAPLVAFAHGATSLLFFLILLGHAPRQEWFVTLAGAGFVAWLGGSLLRRMHFRRWLDAIIGIGSVAALAWYGREWPQRLWLDLAAIGFFAGWTATILLCIGGGFSYLGRGIVRFYRCRPRQQAIGSGLARLALAVAVAPAVLFAGISLEGSGVNLTNSRMLWVLDLVTGQRLLTEAAFLTRLMHDEYLWREHVGEARAEETGQSLNQLLDRLKYKERDRWSYLVTAEEERAWRKGVYRGIGVRWKEDGASWTVAYVHPGSPAEQAGIRRGDELIEINGLSLAEIEKTNQWNTVIRQDRENGLIFAKPDGARLSVNVRKQETQVRSVFQRDVIRSPEQVVGYLVFNQFIAPSVLELGEAFLAFHEEGITELVLDLRYNGGGEVEVASVLAGLIGGSRTAGQVFARLKYNRRYSFEEAVTMRGKAGLGLSRLVVITSGGTCSASEAVINGLRPYLEVITIGSPTCGKPVGMRSIPFRGHSIHPINFEIVNARNEGGYFDGLQPTCAARDDLRHALGDPQEESLGKALYYLRHGRCPLQLQTRGAGDQRAREEREPGLTGFRQEVGAF
jgi:C-terminal processing protease CtpA/Prc